MRKFDGYLKGVNLGGWLSQCLDHYNEDHYSTFITEKDIETIASWGMDHVRVPIDYNVIITEDGQFIESGFKHIDDCIKWCQKNNLKMVFDIHKAKGFVFDNPEYVGFFGDEELQDYFIKLWEEIIRRYGKYSDMMAFELLNEVTELRFAKPWNEILKRTIGAIRKINKDVKIIVGGVFNSSIYGLTLMDEPFDENVIYTMHIYNPFIFTHQRAGWVNKMPRDLVMTYPATVKTYWEKTKEVFGNDFDSDFDGLEAETLDASFFEHLMIPALQVAEKYNVPLYCGEYGVIDQATPEDSLNWYRHIHTALENHDIARAAWTYKKMDFGLSDARMACVLPEITKNL